MANHVMTFEQYCTNQGEMIDEGILQNIVDWATNPNRGQIIANIKTKYRSYIPQGIQKMGGKIEEWVNAFNEAAKVGWNVKKVSEANKKFVQYLLERGEYSAGAQATGTTGANVKKASSSGLKQISVEEFN